MIMILSSIADKAEVCVRPGPIVSKALFHECRSDPGPAEISSITISKHVESSAATSQLAESNDNSQSNVDDRQDTLAAHARRGLSYALIVL